MCQDNTAVAWVCIDTGTYSRCPHVDFQEKPGILFQSFYFFLQSRTPGGKGLSQGHRYCILELGPPHFQHISKLLGFDLQRMNQLA